MNTVGWDCFTYSECPKKPLSMGTIISFSNNRNVFLTSASNWGYNRDNINVFQEMYQQIVKLNTIVMYQIIYTRGHIRKGTGGGWGQKWVYIVNERPIIIFSIQFLTTEFGSPKLFSYFSTQFMLRLDPLQHQWAITHISTSEIYRLLIALRSS